MLSILADVAMDPSPQLDTLGKVRAVLLGIAFLGALVNLAVWLAVIAFRQARREPEALPERTEETAEWSDWSGNNQQALSDDAVSLLIQAYLSLDPQVRRLIKEVDLDAHIAGRDSCRCADMRFAAGAEPSVGDLKLEVDLENLSRSSLAPGCSDFANALSNAVYNISRPTIHLTTQAVAG